MYWNKSFKKQQKQQQREEGGEKRVTAKVRWRKKPSEKKRDLSYLQAL